MSKKFDYEYVVIGSGAAGSAAALLAAGLGVRTAIVEADKWGGSTLNYRDVPYAAALGFAEKYFEAVNGARFGMSSSTLRYNYPTVLNWQATAVRRAGGGNHKIFENAGIDCYHGHASFINSHELVIDDTQISGEKFLLATGSTLSVNGIAGTDTVSCWTPNTVLRMPKLPKAMLIVGGGSTGCEIAEYFGALGVQVLLAESEERLLPKEDPEVSTVIEDFLRKHFQVEVLTNSRVVALTQDLKSKQVIFVRDGQEKSVRVDAIVLATPPEPATDFGLENAGVKYSFDGVKVNSNLRTSCGHIWAAGDILGGESSTEKATYEAKLATMNAIKKAGNNVNYTGFVRMTNTFPQVAKVGMNEVDFGPQGEKRKVSIIPIDSISAANTNDFRDGFVKMTADTKGQVLGATVVAPHADLIVQEISLIIRTGMRVAEIAAAPHVATSWDEAVRIAARELS